MDENSRISQEPTDNETPIQELGEDPGESMGDTSDHHDVEDILTESGEEEIVDVQEDIPEDDDARSLEEVEELLLNVEQALGEVSSIRETLNAINLDQKTNILNLDDYRARMREWNEQGYDIGRLESAVRTKVPELIDRIFDSFERDVGKLQEIGKSLDQLDTTGFKKRETDIRNNLKNPDEVIPTLKHMIELEINIRRRMEMDI
jgi:hypothetical protein